jgi:hypothetical protein
MKSATSTDKPFKQFLRSEVFAAAYWVGALALLVVFAYFNRFKYMLDFTLSDKPEVWGQFGDYVGGVLNPICAYMAFVWLVRSYALQKAELAETREALERTQVAQQRQAEVAFASARIEAASIRLNILSSELNLERQEMTDAKHELQGGVISAEYRGEPMRPQEKMDAVRTEIKRIRNQQRRILDDIAGIEASMVASSPLHLQTGGLDTKHAACGVRKKARPQQAELNG